MQIFRSQSLKIGLVILACVLLSTGVLLLRGDITTSGWILILLGVSLFTFSTLFINKYRPDKLDNPPSSLRMVVSVLLMWLGLALSGYVVATVLSPVKPGYWEGAAWLTSMVLMVVSVRLMSPRQAKESTSLAIFVKSHRFELLALLSILLISTLLRLIDLSTHPYPWSGDEASIGIEGRRILLGEITNFFDAGWSGQPNWSFIPAALSITIFGENLFALRLPSALGGVLAVVFLFLLTREMFGNRTAMLAAVFLAAFPLHLHFSRIGVHNIVDSLMICLVLWLILLAMRKDKLEMYLLAGIATGLTFYTYVGTRLVLGIALLALFYMGIRRRGFIKSHLPHLAIYSLGLFVAIAPMAAFFVDKPDIFLTRISQSSIFSAGWLEGEASLSGISKAAVIWRQFTITVLVFISKPAVSNFFYSPRPYLTVIGAVFFLLGIFYSFVRIFQPRMFVLQAWFWSVILLGGVLTQGAPAHTRMLMTTPALAIFFALGIEQTGDLLRQVKLFTERQQWIIGMFLLMLISAQNIFFYFGEYRAKNYFSDANSELAQQVGLQLRKSSPDVDLYLLGQPRIYIDFPTFEFLAPENERFNLATDEIHSITDPPVRPVLFVAIPENQADLEQIMRQVPGGEFEIVMRAYPDEVLYYAYWIE